MANHRYSEMHNMPMGGIKPPKPGLEKGSTPGMNVKPGFNVGVPGKTQSKDRSGGVKRVPTHPKSEGL